MSCIEPFYVFGLFFFAICFFMFLKPLQVTLVASWYVNRLGLYHSGFVEPFYFLSRVVLKQVPLFRRMQVFAGTRICCEAPEMFCGRQKLHLNFCQCGGE